MSTTINDPVPPLGSAPPPSDDTRRSPWSPLAATLAVIAAIVASFAAAWIPVLAVPLIAAHVSPQFAFGPGMLLTTIVVSQLMMGLAGWWLAGRRGGMREAVLALGPMQVSTGAAALSIVGMFVLTLSYQAFRYYALGHDILADMREMAPLFRTPLWPVTFIVVSLLAPIAEEVLFRGFLLSSFARSTGLYWLGVIVATVIWTALHVQYKVPALLLVALMGVIFSVMLRWSGSLRLPLAAHIANNTVSSIYALYFLTR